jgi:hypothetical protein
MYIVWTTVMSLLFTTYVCGKGSGGGRGGGGARGSSSAARGGSSARGISSARGTSSHSSSHYYAAHGGSLGNGSYGYSSNEGL